MDQKEQEAFINDYMKLVEKYGITFYDCGCCAGLSKILDLPTDTTHRPAFTISTEEFKSFLENQRVSR